MSRSPAMTTSRLSTSTPWTRSASTCDLSDAFLAHRLIDDEHALVYPVFNTPKNAFREVKLYDAVSEYNAFLAELGRGETVDSAIQASNEVSKSLKNPWTWKRRGGNVSFGSNSAKTK